MASEELQQTIAHLKDRQDILDCIMREARGRDRHDLELTRSCYWNEGYDEHGPIITAAPDYPERANAGHAAHFSATSHNITSHTCEIDGNTAHCESYVVGGLLTKDEHGCVIAMGRYIDRLEKRGGEWRILHRRCTVDMAMDGGTEWLHSPAVNGFLKSVWGKEDRSYQRPVSVGKDGIRWGDA
ncbi:nuclear transport factor 2 family protein [Erythrobacter alti]|uniref:nuclear transport factor 2 family protein n=1 Tax=Erythrobacter alti TaxID=1896145 RepID=UPI0030F451FE